MSSEFGIYILEYIFQNIIYGMGIIFMQYIMQM